VSYTDGKIPSVKLLNLVVLYIYIFFINVRMSHTSTNFINPKVNNYINLKSSSLTSRYILAIYK
jgi:hypothetical protein